MNEKKVLLYERTFETEIEYKRAIDYIDKKNLLTFAKRELPTYLQRAGFSIYESKPYRYMALYQDPDFELHTKASNAIASLGFTLYGEVDGYIHHSAIVREDLGVVSADLRLYAAFERDTLMHMDNNDYLFRSENRFYNEWNRLILYSSKTYVPGSVPDIPKYHSKSDTDPTLRIFRSYGIPEITVARKVIGDHKNYVDTHSIADYLLRVNSEVGVLTLNAFVV